MYYAEAYRFTDDADGNVKMMVAGSITTDSLDDLDPWADHFGCMVDRACLADTGKWLIHNHDRRTAVKIEIAD